MYTLKKTMAWLLAVFMALSVSVAVADTPPIVDKVKTGTSDTLITTKIKTLYVGDDKLSPFKIEVETKKGKVHLKGTVDTEKEYQDAVTTAASVDGVKSVDVKHLSVKTDTKHLKDFYLTGLVKGFFMQKDLTKSLLGEKHADLSDIEVTTKDSVVHLSGELGDKAEKDKIVKMVKDIDGVKSVNADDLEVK